VRGLGGDQSAAAGQARCGKGRLALCSTSTPMSAPAALLVCQGGLLKESWLRAGGAAGRQAPLPHHRAVPASPPHRALASPPHCLTAPLPHRAVPASPPHRLTAPLPHRAVPACCSHTKWCCRSRGRRRFTHAGTRARHRHRAPAQVRQVRAQCAVRAGRQPKCVRALCCDGCR